MMLSKNIITVGQGEKPFSMLDALKEHVSPVDLWMMGGTPKGRSLGRHRVASSLRDSCLLS